MRGLSTRIGVFYDGGFYSSVSNYYKFEHPKRMRLSFDGIHDFIRERVAKEVQVDKRFASIVEAHFFRGRRSLKQIEVMEEYRESVGRSSNLLEAEKVFDDLLIRLAITPHYLPLQQRGEELIEKGVDVWLALEAFEMAVYKRFDVCVLIAGDSDYIPLVRKLIALGVDVMLLGWTFERTNYPPRKSETKTSYDLQREVTFSVCMDEMIDSPENGLTESVKRLFVGQQDQHY